jgi:hypothetical protein
MYIKFLETYLPAKYMFSNTTNTTDTVAFSFVLGVGIPDTVEWLISLAVRITLLIFCIVWRKEQPLKSRHPIPITFAVSFMLVYDSTLIFAMWTYANWWPEYVQAVRFFYTIPLISTMFLAVNYQYIRYFTLRYLDNAKLSGSATSESTPVRFLRVLVSRQVVLVEVLSIAVLFLISTVFIILCFVLGPSSDVNLYLTRGTLMTTFFIIEVGFNGAVVIGLACICAAISLHDIIRHMPQLGISKYFGESDPYKYRLDGLINFILIIGYIFVMIIMVLPIGAPVISDPGAQVYWVIIRIANWIAQLCVFIGSGLSCVVTIARIKLQPKEPIDETEMQRLLRVGGKGVKLFEEYIKSEFSSENMLCYKKTVGYQRLSTRQLSSLAEEVYENYVKVGTLAEVNLPEKVRSSFERTTFSEATEEQLQEMFRKLDEELTINLGDSYMRFKYTSTYKEQVAPSLKRK